ncbi:MAG: hypothetical protein IPO68_00470 [Chitinophagaceae bacterium]|nr:hypothetical protein [Chitinophagaceae bacterium]
MKRIIDVVVLLVALVTIACNNKQPPQNTTGSTQSIISADTLPHSAWSVNGCAEKATRKDTKFPASGEYTDYPGLPSGDALGIKSNGDSIVYNRFEEHLCCRQVKVAIAKKDNIITITEYWFGKGCKCKCSSTVNAVIRQLPKGEYQVYAVATGTNPVDDKPTEGRDTVMSQKVTIR